MRAGIGRWPGALKANSPLAYYGEIPNVMLRFTVIESTSGP